MLRESILTQATALVGNRGEVLSLITRLGGYEKVQCLYREYSEGVLRSQRLSMAEWLAAKVTATVANSKRIVK